MGRRGTGVVRRLKKPLALKIDGRGSVDRGHKYRFPVPNSKANALIDLGFSVVSCPVRAMFLLKEPISF